MTSEAKVSCNSVPSNAPHRMNTHASTIAKRPNSRAISKAKARKRSPSRAKRGRAAVRAGEGEGGLVGEGEEAGSLSPHSSKRYWLEGITRPQRLQCFACEVTWLWQFGHSMMRRPSPSVPPRIPCRIGSFVSPKDSGRVDIVRSGEVLVSDGACGFWLIRTAGLRYASHRRGGRNASVPTQPRILPIANAELWDYNFPKFPEQDGGSHHVLQTRIPNVGRCRCCICRSHHPERADQGIRRSHSEVASAWTGCRQRWKYLVHCYLRGIRRQA